MGTEIDFSSYDSIINDYAAARALILLSMDYLEEAVNVVVALNEVIPEVDLLQDFWDTYQVAVETVGSVYNFVQAVRSLQNHIVNRGDETDINDWLEVLFPNLKKSDYNITSPYDPAYNCIAWAAEDTSSWWEPDPMGIYYWPPEVPRKYSIEAYRAAYESIGYKEISEEVLEFAYQKVAIFSKAGIPTHASRQLKSGYWSSKLGKSVDIEHRVNVKCCV